MSQPLSLSEFFKSGKMDSDFEVKEGYVTGVCVLYAERTAGEQEYMIRERSIVMLEGRELSGCVQEAKDLAWQSALKRLSDMPAPPAAKSGQQKPKPQVSAAPASQTPAAAAPLEDEPEPADAPGPAVDGDAPFAAEQTGEASGAHGEDDAPVLGGARQVGFADLRPASSLLKQEAAPIQAAGYGPNEEDDKIEKARAVKISIVGKLHQCNGWTAGRILDEAPEVVVEFANRYNGPKVEERDALRTLYTEALRRVNRAA